MQSIYLDNAATTQPLPSLSALQTEYMRELWHNPSALYRPAGEAARKLGIAREILLRAFGSAEYRCLFTSGGTEGANMVIKQGVSRRKDGNVVCAGFEHPCVEQSFRSLDAGQEVRFAPVDKYGRTDADALLSCVDERTLLVSVMHVNNETGAKNDVAALASAVKQRAPKALVHVDGVQAFLRTPPPGDVAVDYYTVSAHKVHALKGTGALFYRPHTPLKPLIHGGGQEGGLRSGTENTLGILAFSEAVSWFLQQQDLAARMGEYRARFLRGLKSMQDAVLVTPEDPSQAAPNILTVSFPGIRGETLMHLLEEEDIYISTGSACSSRKGKSRFEKALGVPKEIAQGTVRISWSINNTPAETDRVLERLGKKVQQLRRTTGR